MEEARVLSPPVTSKSSNFQLRTSKFIQKITTLRSRIALSGRYTKETPGPYMRRDTSSMDVSSKPFMSQPALAIAKMPLQGATSSDDSSQPAGGPSSSPSPAARHSISTAIPYRGNASVFVGERTYGRIDGLPSVHERILHPATMPPAPPVSQSLKTGTPVIVLSGPPISPNPHKLHNASNEDLFTPQQGGTASSSSHMPPHARFISNSSAPRNRTIPVTVSIPNGSPPPSVPSASESASDISSMPRHVPSNRPPPPTRQLPPDPPETPTRLSSATTDSPADFFPTTPTTNPSATLPTRRPPPRLLDFPSSRRFSLSVDDGPGSARLSPSIITRQMPMPILNLPTLRPLPTPTPQRPNSDRRRAGSQAHLRSMPALPMAGPGHGAAAGEHEDAEEDMDADPDDDIDDGATDETHADVQTVAGDSDGEDDEAVPRTSVSSENSYMPGATPKPPPAHVAFDFSFRPPPDLSLGKGKARETRGPTADAIPVASEEGEQPQDYFSSRRTPSPSSRNGSQSPARTPRPKDVLRTPESVASRRADGMPLHPKITPMPSPLGNGVARPGIYQQASRSMINILSTKRQTIIEVEEEEAAELKAALMKVETLRGKGKQRADADATTSDAPSVIDARRETSEATSTLPGRKLGAAPAYDMIVNPLRRRRSMPTFNAATLPPPYPSFDPRTSPHPLDKSIIILPREDEGRESLPQYTNDIYLKAIMPRKMEFTKPGVQAPDRKWRRVMCVLEGTVFRVYRCPPAISGVSAFGDWWERKVGVGDASVHNPVRPPVKKAESERMKATAEDERDAVPANQNGAGSSSLAPQQSNPPQPPSGPSHHHPNRSKLNIAVNLLRPGGSNRPRSRSDIPNSPNPTASPRSSLSIPRPSLGSRSSGSVSRSGSGSGTGVSGSSRPRSPSSPTAVGIIIPPNSATVPESMASSSSRSHLHGRPLHSDTPDPDPSDLLYAYTLQHAESGLGNDYAKRRNVIRVRMEGEQFLLQAKDVSDVVEWIEGFHAAINIALDLDERVMPKGPIFPRRRRRRAGTQLRTDGNRPSTSNNQTR